MSNVKKLSCIHCGNPFEVYPPDDLHHFATRRMEDYGDNIWIRYTCKGCKKINLIYWANPQSATTKTKPKDSTKSVLRKL